MPKKEKKPLTTKQTQYKHRALEYASFAGMGVSVATPTIIMSVVNQKEWFLQGDGWRVGLGAALGMAVVAFAIVIVSIKKKKENNTALGGWITIMIIWAAFAAIIKLLEKIYHELFELMMWTLLGLAFACGFDLLGLQDKEVADAYKSARKNTNQESIEEKAMKEVEEEEKAKQETQKIKVKVKG